MSEGDSRNCRIKEQVSKQRAVTQYVFLSFLIVLFRFCCFFAAFGNDGGSPSSMIGLRSVNEIRILIEAPGLKDFFWINH